MLESYLIWMIFHCCLAVLFSLFLYFHKFGFGWNLLLLLFLNFQLVPDPVDLFLILEIILKFFLPAFNINLFLFGFSEAPEISSEKTYCVKMKLQTGSIKLENIRRGISIIGSAGSGKTQSVVFNLLKHFNKHSFCGLIHDYKNFEITEIAYPLFRSGEIPFYIVSFDEIFHRVNPIAPKYLPDQESVNEVSRVLLENLLEQKDFVASGTVRFFNDAAEGLIAGMIWRLKSDFPRFCTLPHLIALYQCLDNESLADFLSTDKTSRAMANAFISGIDSERQTAAIRSTLANAFKKITSERIFMALSKDEIPLNINDPENPAVVCIVNNPKLETAYSPVIATIIHTITKQMSLRYKSPSFLLMEEAPTIRLLNMHRVPATLRSYNISTVYVMQDKSQNDLLYGEKASKAILSNLSYQFFGKTNNPDTAKYFERFFELSEKENISISQSQNLDFDSRITRSQREVPKIRADRFFRLAPGEFLSFCDGKDKHIRFSREKMKKMLPEKFTHYTREEISLNFEEVYRAVEKEILIK